MMAFTRFETWDDVVTVPLTHTPGQSATVLHRVLWGWRDGRWWRVKDEIDLAAPCAQARDA